MVLCRVRDLSSDIFRVNNDIKADGTVVNIKKSRKVVGFIEPIKAKDIRLGPTSSKETSVLEQVSPQEQYEKAKKDFLIDLAALIGQNPVFNTHRLPPHIIAHHMSEAAHLFNATLFLHNTAVTMQNKKDE